MAPGAHTALASCCTAGAPIAHGTPLHACTRRGAPVGQSRTRTNAAVPRVHNCRRAAAWHVCVVEIFGTQKRRRRTSLPGMPRGRGGPPPAPLPSPRGTRSQLTAGQRLAWQCEAAAASSSHRIKVHAHLQRRLCTACVSLREKGIAATAPDAPPWAAAPPPHTTRSMAGTLGLSWRVRGAHVHTRVWCGGPPRPLMQGKAPGRFYNQPSSRAQRRAMSGG